MPAAVESGVVEHPAAITATVNIVAKRTVVVWPLRFIVIPPVRMLFWLDSWTGRRVGVLFLLVLRKTRAESFDSWNSALGTAVYPE